MSLNTLTTNPLASTTELILTNAWGNRTLNNYKENSTLSATIGYTGHTYNQSTDLIYAHARYLNTSNKLWLSHDPYSINNFTDAKWLMNPQAQNSYSYANNDPVNNVDPDGRVPIDIIADAGFILYDIGSASYNLYKGN